MLCFLFGAEDLFKMIQKQELRHNNFVKDRGGKTLQIDYFELDKVCQKVELQYGQIGHPLTEYFDYLEPIKITDEILSKTKPNLLEWFCEGSYMLVKDEEFGHCFKVRNASHTKEIEFGYFRFVHQLQNLYFCLTGKELEFVAQHSI